MNRFASVFFAFALAFFLVGTARFFFPQWFQGGILDFSSYYSNTSENVDPNSENTEKENSPKTAEERFLEETPDDEVKLFERAQQFYSHGALSLAENDLGILIEKNSKHKEAFVMLIKLQVQIKDFAAAETTAEKALKGNFANDSEFIVLLGDLYLQQAKVEKARETFLTLPENSSERNFFLGLIALYDGKYDEAENMIQKTTDASKYKTRSDILLAAFKEFSLFPDGSPLHRDVLLAKALNEVEQFELSLALSKKVLVENPGYRDAWIVNGYSYLALRRPEFAQNAFEQAYEIDPANTFASYFLGIAYKKLRDYDRALSFFDRALKNGFEPPQEVMSEIADIYYLQGNYELAFQEYEDMLKKFGGTEEEFVRPMNIVLTFLQKPEMGILLGNLAIESHPTDPMSFNLRGWAYLENGNLELSEKDLQKSLALDANFVPAKLNMGILREKQGRLEEALDLYEYVYKADPLSAIGEKAVEKYNALLK
ncbi:tetratricopeptide repeat protein [Candidatus Peregrinibacteria bacterium]|nr:tetratricopeptide repeat protein [Candidatus Peregrinibacteria bacterium]